MNDVALVSGIALACPPLSTTPDVRGTVAMTLIPIGEPDPPADCGPLFTRYSVREFVFCPVMVAFGVYVTDDTLPDRCIVIICVVPLLLADSAGTGFVIWDISPPVAVMWVAGAS